MPCFDSLVSASEDAMVSLTDLEGRVLWFSRNARDLLPSFFDNHLIGRTGLEFEPVAKSPLGEVVKGIIRDQPPSFETGGDLVAFSCPFLCSLCVWLVSVSGPELHVCQRFF